MKLEANAKINIGLAVGKRGEDGYHPIRSYFARLSLCDRINVDISPSSTFSCSISSNTPYLDNGKVDIMEKCARAFSEKTGNTFNINISIDKKIPCKAGFGGGSSDGAAVIKYLNTYFNNPLSKDKLLELGGSCGSDIPFFLSGYSFAYVSGRGEILDKAVLPKGFDYALLFMPNREVSTAEAYKALDLLSYEFKKLPCSFSYPISKDDFPNDFERICKNTLVDSLLDIYKDKAFVSLSGSGSGCFVLARKDDVDFLESIAPFEYIKARIL